VLQLGIEETRVFTLPDHWTFIDANSGPNTQAEPARFFRVIPRMFRLVSLLQLMKLGFDP
jgi:hypothetical protein